MKSIGTKAFHLINFQKYDKKKNLKQIKLKIKAKKPKTIANITDYTKYTTYI